MKEIEVAEQEIKEENTRNVKHYKKKEFFSLCGISITAEGQLIKSDMFKFLQLDPEEYGDIVLTAEDARRVHGRLIGVKWGGAAAKVPLYCGGEEICPFKNDCPFVEIGKIPVGRKCPIEVELIAYWTARYMEEFDVDPDNQSELSLITELAELDIYDYRCSMILSRAENAELTQHIVVGVDADGRPIYNEDIHKAFELKERVKRRKDKILEALVGTRKEKYKRDAALKKRSEDDPSTQAAELKRKLDEARAKAAADTKPVSEEIIDVED
jgi:hypothetical protein